MRSTCIWTEKNDMWLYQSSSMWLYQKKYIPASRKTENLEQDMDCIEYHKTIILGVWHSDD